MSDLAGLFTAAPAGPAMPMSYRQGVVVEFDPATLANRLLVGGAYLDDVPVLGVAEAASLAAGSVVGLMVVGSTWAIIGRIVTPGTVEATDAITLVSQRTKSDTIATSEATASTSYTDLATVGPTVTGVPIGVSGRAVVSVGAVVGLLTGGVAFMSFSISGATTAAADDTRAYIVADNLITIGASKQVTVSGLTPGLHTFTAKYRAVNETIAWFDRTITVTAL